MHDHEAIEMMQRCKHEIISLRNEIDRLRPKADAYDFDCSNSIADAAPVTGNGREFGLDTRQED